MSERPTPVLYLDLDGTVRHGVDDLGRFVNSPDDVVVFPEAVELMRRWKQGGGRIIGVSNQGGIALGYMSHSLCAQTMLRTHKLTGELFDKISARTPRPPGGRRSSAPWIASIDFQWAAEWRSSVSVFPEEAP